MARRHRRCFCPDQWRSAIRRRWWWSGPDTCPCDVDDDTICGFGDVLAVLSDCKALTPMWMVMAPSASATCWPFCQLGPCDDNITPIRRDSTLRRRTGQPVRLFVQTLSNRVVFH